jgi:hypothetical protein
MQFANALLINPTWRLALRATRWINDRGGLL